MNTNVIILVTLLGLAMFAMRWLAYRHHNKPPKND